MFFPEQMQKIELLIVRKDVEAVAREIVRFGDFQVIEIDPLKASESLLTKTSSPSQALVDLGRRLERVAEEFGLTLPPYTGQGNDAPPLESLEQQVRSWEKELEKFSLAMENLRSRRQTLIVELKKISFFAEFTPVLGDFRDLAHFRSGFGVVPLASVEGFQSAMSTFPSVVHQVGYYGDGMLVFYSVGTRWEEKLASVLKNCNFRSYGLPDTAQSISGSRQFTLAFELNNLTDEELWEEKHFQARRAEIQPLILKASDQLSILQASVRLKAEMAETQTVTVFSGWVPRAEVPRLQARISELTDGRLVIEARDAMEVMRTEGLYPPTRLKNPAFLKPFEVLVSTFGMPSYREIDPTPLAAAAYVLMYGAMFGDVGHGLMIAGIGCLFWLFKKMDKIRFFGVILLAIGISSTMFGLLYGEIFGDEEILKPLWLRPAEHILDLLVIAVAFGVVMLSLGLVLSMINSLREKNFGRFLFSPTGLAGLLFYWGILGLLLGMGGYIPWPRVLYGLPLAGVVMIALEKHLGRLFFAHEGSHEKPSLVTGLVEVFDAVISFATKTISFMRLAAFAVNHGALMSVVFIMAGMTSNPVLQWLIILGGNLFVIGFEGFIVGIQALRLEYYEFFVNFFRGSGRAFEGFSIYRQRR